MPKAQPKLELETAQRILALLDCPRALTVSIMLKYGHYDDICSLRAVPEDFNDPESFRLAYQATRLLQKSEWLPTTFDRKARAVEAFQAAEVRCASTNQLFSALRLGHACVSPGVWKKLLSSRRKVHEVLSRVNPYSFLDLCGFGPGSDMSTRNGETAAYDKLSSPGTITRGATLFYDFFASNSYVGCVSSWDIDSRSIVCDRVPGNKVTFVPKDCKTDRPIAVEPRWNIFFQKGVGALIRKALLKTGIDLNDQTKNQKLARYGSLTGSLATLDLQSASDSVSFELVRFMLPDVWFDILSRLRSPKYSLNGEWFDAHKWSSMGNGYTFELESLLFYAICWSVCGDRVSVYGDDLVVPTESAQEVVELLTISGFVCNENKSFSSGPFRESCGGDYFLGVDVTPIYWKDRLDDQGTLRLVNQVTRLARRFSDGHCRDRRFRRVWRDLVHRLPSHFRRSGPTSIEIGRAHV